MSKKRKRIAYIVDIKLTGSECCKAAFAFSELRYFLQIFIIGMGNLQGISGKERGLT